MPTLQLGMGEELCVNEFQIKLLLDLGAVIKEFILTINDRYIYFVTLFAVDDSQRQCLENVKRYFRFGIIMAVLSLSVILS